MYYVSLAIWMDEAFAFFVSGVEKTSLIQALFILFLVSGYLNLIRGIKVRFSGNKIGFVAWLMLSAGAMLYLTGFFLSINVRQFDSRLAGEGDVIRPSWSSENYRVVDLSPGIKSQYKKSGQDGLLDHEPEITLIDGLDKAYRVGAYPPVKIGRTYFHILNYGIAPGVELFENGRLIQSGYMALRLLPPGRSDYFDIMPYPYRFLVSLAPETDHGGTAQAPVFNLENPRYSTRVFSGEKVIAEGDSGEALSFDRFALGYFRHTYWVQLEAAKDPGIPIIKYGIFLIVFGMPVYLLRLVIALLPFRN